jgi:hypothetical protein
MKLSKVTSQPKSATIPIPKTYLQNMIRQNQIRNNNTQYYQKLYQERASILQYDGGYSEGETEVMAREEILAICLENDYALKVQSCDLY